MTTLSDLKLELNKVFEKDTPNFEVVKSLMANYNSNRKEWEQYAMFSSERLEYAEVNGYTRNLIHEGNGKFNLIVLCWNKNQGSRIHSHANSHCFMKVLEGKIREERYDWPTKEQNSPSECGQNDWICKQSSVYNRNDIIYICDEIGLHKVENPSDADKTVTLHLYYPPLQECFCFDQTTGQKTATQMTYWSKFGQRT